MKVTKEPFEDAGERDADGYFDYYYSGVIYRFDFPDHTYFARRYDDTPTEAAFMPIRSAPGGVTVKEIPYHDQDFLRMVEYLRQDEGIEVVLVVLLSKYVQIDFNKFLD